ALDAAPLGATVPFHFDIPFECQPTDAEDGRIYWQVAIRTRRHANAGTFLVPVSRTDASSPNINEKTLRPRTISQPPYSKLRLQRAPDGAVEVRFPRPTWIWKWWLFTLVVTGAGVVVVRDVLDPGITMLGYGGVAGVALF